jgi:acetolactate synthase-1/2/3 large subunit
MTVEARADVAGAVQTARAHKGATLINFRVEKEDSVYPMVPTGADLGEMIRRPAPQKEPATVAD